MLSIVNRIRICFMFCLSDYVVTLYALFLVDRNPYIPMRCIYTGGSFHLKKGDWGIWFETVCSVVYRLQI